MSSTLTRRSLLTGAAALGATGLLPARSAAAAATDPADLGVLEALTLLRSRSLSATELLAACRMRAAEHEPTVQAFLLHTDALADTAAAAADRRYARGRPLPLDGIPVGLKDLYYVRGVETTASSKALSGFKPDFDATVWARLRDAGGVHVGKLNTQEFALGNATPPTANPWNPAHTPGGSSGGPAAALAARMVLAASGSDTGGSIRIPSSACGVVGLKPTYGRVSRHGVISLSWSMDTAGMMGRSVADVAYLTQLVAGHDPADPTSRALPVPTYSTAAPRDLKGVRVGIPSTYFWDVSATQPDILAACQAAVRQLQHAGATVVDVDLPPVFAEVMNPALGADPSASPLLAALSHPALLVLTEAFGYHEPLILQRGSSYSTDTLAAINLGGTVMAPDYLRTQQLRHVFVREMTALFHRADLDVLAHPTLRTDPPTTQRRTPANAGLENGLALSDLMFPANFAGMPSLSVPVGLSALGLPVGLCLTGRHFEEATVLAVGLVVDEAHQFHARQPAGLA
ncbi:MAG: aspartyl-tRNA(Asn)/glutamyl-tRNA(Gln) amidotransferase subunit [Frankiales bacterium]|nr:aspartyl-tRNA(Asn)/glutamyl-tRNA(Gln) amidotransferase subunit [Frankiales bacterium]